MPLTRALRHTFVYAHRWMISGLALLVVLASCGNEPTAPGATGTRMARGLSFVPVFPAMSLSGSAASQVAFSSVHIVLHHADGSVAIDTTIVFPADSQQVTASLNVKLDANAPAAGEPLTLDLGYLNAAGDVVFKGGPVTVIATQSLPGAAPPSPISIPVVYSGPGANAKSVRISQRTVTTTAGNTFSYTAVGLDDKGNPVANTPIVWASLDPATASIPNSTSGNGQAVARGTARIVAQLIVGSPAPADTVLLTVNAIPASLSLVSGSGQTAVVGKATPALLAQPLLVVVKSSDGQPVPGVTVSFAAVSGGFVSPASATTDIYGYAQASWTLGNLVGDQIATASLAGVTGSPVTFTATGIAAVATKLAISTAPAGASLKAGAPFTFAVVARDVDGDPVTGFTGAVSVALSANPSGATLGGTTTVNAVNGVATFSNLAISKPGTGFVLTASSANLTPVASPAFNISNGTATALKLMAGGNQTALAGTALQPIIVVAVDAVGNPVPNVQVDFAVAQGSGSNTPVSVTTDAVGSASTMWTLGSAPGAQTLNISSSAIPGVSLPVTATANVYTWAITTQPATTQSAGSAFTVVATLKDQSNNVVTSYSGSASIALGTNPGVGTLGGTATVTAVSGVATFSGLTLSEIGSGYTLVVSTTGNPTGHKSGTTNAFNVGAGAPSGLSVLSGANQAAIIGSVLQPIVVKVVDAFGNPVPSVQVDFGATGGASSTPPTAATDALGRASTTWTLGNTPGTQVLSITSASIAGLAVPVTATANAYTWVITTQPTINQMVGNSFTVTATLKDQSNNVVSSYTGSANIALGANPGGSTLGGTTGVTATAGVATFSGLTLSQVGNGYTLVVSTPGNPTGYSSGTTSAFNVGAAAASALSLVSGGNQTALAGTVLQPIVVLVADAFGNPVPNVQVNFGVTAGGGSNTPLTVATDAQGHASTTWTLGSTPGTQALSVTSPSIAGVSVPVTATANVFTWAITTQPPTNQAVGVAFTVAATLKDQSNNVVSSYSGSASIALGANPGNTTLGGTKTVTAVAGVATFSGLTLSEVGSGYTLVVSSPGSPTAFKSGTTNAMNVGAGPASVLSLQSTSQGAIFGQALSQPVSVKVTDAFGNAVSGAPVTFTIASGGGSVTPASTTTNGGGIANASWTLGPSGPQTLTVASPGLIGSPLSVSATPATNVMQTIVSGSTEANPAIGNSRPITVQGFNASNQPVSGTWTWVSRNPAIVTVDANGIVTSVTNGSAYVVATEAGGTKDSLLVTVQQRTWSINVTPATQTLHVGNLSTYTAQALDFNNFVLGTQPVFAWTSTTPAAASVNASTGAVNALAVGTTQIRATFGTVVGTGNLTVTP